MAFKKSEHLKSGCIFLYTPFEGSLIQGRGSQQKRKEIVVAHVNHLGPKITGISRHHTIIKFARPIIYRIQSWLEVERVRSSIISAGGHRGIKVWDASVGLRIKIYDTSEAQEFFIYTDQPGLVKEKLRAEFDVRE